MKRYDITIIFDGEILKFEGIQDIREDSTNIRFKDKDEHQHNFHMVSYHIESYYPPLPKKNLPSEETQEGIVNDSITGIQTENKRNLCTVRNVPASFIEICPCTGLFHLDQYQHGIYDCTG